VSASPASRRGRRAAIARLSARDRFIRFIVPLVRLGRFVGFDLTWFEATRHHLLDQRGQARQALAFFEAAGEVSKAECG
jgi:hypothetical protein